MGGPITITHPDIIIFMTIKEAAQLVIQAANLAKRVTISLDMGEPVLIKDLKKNDKTEWVKKCIGQFDTDIEIIYRIKTGEKLYEELLINGESIPTQNPLIFRAKRIL